MEIKFWVKGGIRLRTPVNPPVLQVLQTSCNMHANICIYLGSASFALDMQCEKKDLPLCPVQTETVKISLYICIVLAGLSLYAHWYCKLVTKVLGPVVQSVVSLTSSLRVFSLTVLAASICNILIFFAEKMWVAFALQKLLTFFQQKNSAYLCITRFKF